MQKAAPFTGAAFIAVRERDCSSHLEVPRTPDGRGRIVLAGITVSGRRRLEIIGPCGRCSNILHGPLLELFGLRPRRAS